KKIGKTDADIEQMMQPDLIVNGKEKDGIGKYDQLEGALGASVLNFNLNLEKLRKENKNLDDWMNARLGKNQPLVQVVMASKQDREEVFTPIKKAFDFWKQATNWVVVNGNNWLTKSPKGHGTVNVSVKNSKGQAKQNYKDVSYFMDNWTNDDISELDKLSVDGYNVKLQNLKLDGEVIIENETGEDFVISKIEDLASENISIEAISKKYGIKNVTLKDFEYDRNSNSLRRTGEEKNYLVLKDVKIIKKSDGSVAIENLNKGYTETVNAATAQTTGTVKSLNDLLQRLAVNAYSLFKEKPEIVAVVDEKDIKTIEEAKQLAKQGIKVNLILVENKQNVVNETGAIATDSEGNLSFELIDNTVNNLNIYSYESVDGQAVNVVDNVLEKMGNINKAKKILYVSSELVQQGQNRTALNSAVMDNTILTYSQSSISEAVVQGIVAYKNKDKALNTVIGSNSMIASYDVNEEINYEVEIANLNSQKISRVMIKVNNENDIENAKEKAKEFSLNENGIADVIVVLDNNGTYEIVSENEKSEVVNYETARKMINDRKDTKGVIVYIGSQEQDNLILTADDMKSLIDNGAVLAFDSDVLNYMDAENTKDNGITLLGVIKAIFTQSSPEAKRNRAIEKGRNLVKEKGTVSKEDIEKLKSEVKSDEEKECIELGVLQASELQKIDADLLKDLNDRADIANELLTMLGEYRKLAGKSFKMGDGESKINGKENINTVLNNLRQEYKSATTDEAKVAAISGIIQILLTDRLASINDIENLTDNMDIKSISALLSAA
ncbi:hypothetical protein, partial [Candidatus Ruminimicrobium bovinum]|uniref:hypothetical protein n=1 Tax=Candidatus Ruminimicrobium bovinum TaxID=3242779 RepID=UPI0039B9A253